jgi:seryl-tRNA synthetase
MHDIRAIRANPETLKAAMLRRNKPDEAGKVESVVALDQAYRAALTEKEALLARRNAASKEIGQAMAQKDVARAEALKVEVAAGKEKLAELEVKTAGQETEIRELLAGIPNIPKDDVPEGADEHGNLEYVVSARPALPEIAGTKLPIPAKRIETGKDHVELGEALGLIDFETAAKISGSRFVVTKGQVARLERALGQFMLDTHTSEHGYMEVNPPILVKDDAMFGTAQLPKFREDQFKAVSEISNENREKWLTRHGSAANAAVGSLESYMDSVYDYFDTFSYVEGLTKPQIESIELLVELIKERIALRRDDVSAMVRSLTELAGKHRSTLIGAHWLIPTSEVPLTNLVREKILSEEELPLRFTALTPCFRAEAGSAGRDTRGMLRQHQFNKVELVSITTPETSAHEHERMLAAAESVLKKLGLHFRTMTLCTGDMGFASQKTYDIEVWLPGQNTYREISSCSVCGDFQARRMDARFRKSGEKETRFVHTLNGSGVAVGRCLIAVMENYQNPDGSIEVPDVLRPYMGGLARIGG